MPRLRITTRDGVTHEVEGEPGRSIMEVIRDAGIDELLALCGGCLSCATCHVHVASEWLGSLPPMNSDEDDLLDSASDRDGTSRLSCQLPFCDQLDGMAVKVAAGD